MSQIRKAMSGAASHLTPNIGTMRCTLALEFEPWWQQTLYRTRAQHLRFFHDSIWFNWLDTLNCLSNFSSELWNRKLKKNKNNLNCRKFGRTVEIRCCLVTYQLHDVKRDYDVLLGADSVSCSYETFLPFCARINLLCNIWSSNWLKKF